jgi:hypothetical protein
MTTTQNIESYDSLYEKLRDDTPDGQELISEEQYEKSIDELHTTGYIVFRRQDDNLFIGGRPGLMWADIHSIDDPIKKNILLYLIDNPNVFFVLYNTQKGKSRIAAMEMKQWALCTEKKIVSLFIVDNDKTLADQTSDGVIKSLTPNVKVFTLSSSSKTTIDEIRTYIDAYAHDDDYVMPVIVLLPNTTQNEKMVSLLAHIRRKVLRNGSKLRYGIIVDEADKTYPMIRDKKFAVGHERYSLLDFIINEEALHRVGFVTATDGDLLEEYDECRNAYMHPIDVDENAKADYRAFHTTPDAIVNITNLTGLTKSNNAYAEHVLTTNMTDIKTPILHNGFTIYRKIIVNSNPKGTDMTTLARFANNNGLYAITFNQSGICVYRDGRPVEKFKIKGMRLNEILFCIYKIMQLQDKPIVIIGRRKVDRGLGFHYAPRKNPTTRQFEPIVISWKGNDNYPGGDVIAVNGEGLIWTDMILGRIEDTSTAAQKAGRLAGIIGQCPQYTGKLYFWTDAHTDRRIRMHNEKVDITNTLPGAYSAIQCVIHAADMVIDIPIEVPPPDHVVHPELFLTDDLAKAWCTAHLIDGYGSSKFGLYKADETAGTVRNGTHIKKRGQLCLICSREETERGDLGWGVGTSARIMPVRENGQIQYIVIYKRDKLARN